jgi:metallo-beta-lactamase family protein
MSEETRLPPFVVTCWGAAHSVTGSMHLVQAGERRVLLDCGIMRGPRHPLLADGRHFHFEPSSIDAVVLSHAHIDHSGNLPKLIRHGFRGPIYCTPQTRELTALMLADSARIQEEEAHVLRVIGVPGGKEIQPAYDSHDVDQAYHQYIGVPYGEAREIFPGVTLVLANAGHILGSAMVHLRLTAGERVRSLTFTGDLGRPGLPLLYGPDPVPEADLILTESTNGGRMLPPLSEAVVRLEALVCEAAERGGKVIIPGFSAGRIQVLLYYLLAARRAERIPDVPIWVDSPLAADITEVYRRHTGDEFPIRPSDDNGAPAEVEFARTLEASRELSQQRGPAIILAPGGMCDGTRIQNHLRANVDDPRCIVVLVSYQAPGSTGRRLLQPGPTVRIQGKKWNRWAEIVELAGFSGHPDENELLAYLLPLARRARKVRLVHGEAENAAQLETALRARGFHDVAAAVHGEAIVIE